MDFLSPDFPEKFQPFSTSHVITMAIAAALWVSLPWQFRSRKDARADRVFRHTLAFVLLSQSLGFALWEALVGRFTLAHSLPLNLCDITNILCAVLLFRPTYKLYEVIYFWALAGSIQSFVTPNIAFGFPHLEFFVFYIQHAGEFLAILYVTIVLGFEPRAISIARSFGVLCAYIVLVYLFNLATGSNYMFLMADTPHPSTVSKMIALFGDPPRHVLGLGVVAAVSYAVLYAPFFIKKLVGNSRSKGGSY